MPSIDVLIVSYSRFGVLRLMAEYIADGARSVPGTEVHLIEVEDLPIDTLRPGETEAEHVLRRGVLMERISAADALIVGAPAYFGSMASPVKRFFEDCLTAESAPPAIDRSRPWRHTALRDTVGAAFTASGTPHGGNELALHSILTLFMHLGMLVVTPGQGQPILSNPAAPYGATAITGASGDASPTPEEQAAARALGERVARVATWVSLGRSAQTARTGGTEDHPFAP
ncbi:MAG TPA: NAD(P)H-dependent oxidoreductase [Chloroflexota bacterium]|nr:NAD(P)H-dependent oxidoreductase [Chloroflexota bacterium]